MIIGIGNDITDIRRIEKTLKQFGERFEKRIFTDGEQKKARGRQKAGKHIMAATYAKRFAAKEACAKALGMGLKGGVFWRDMEVTNLKSGRPTMKLTGGALKVLKALLPKGAEAVIHVSLSDDYPFAMAHIVIEAV